MRDHKLEQNKQPCLELDSVGNSIKKLTVSAL